MTEAKMPKEIELHRESLCAANELIAQVLNHTVAAYRSGNGWGPASAQTPNQEGVMFDIEVRKTGSGNFLLSALSHDKALYDDEVHQSITDAKERALELWGVAACQWTTFP